MSPGHLRGRLESINAEVRAIEQELVKHGAQGVIRSYEIRFEMTESSEAIERAIAKLDENYRGAS